MKPILHRVSVICPAKALILFVTNADVNECEEKSRCHDNATCANLPGSYTCRCDVGFSGTGKICWDINECDGLIHNCHDNATCTNVVGSHRCDCNDGYSGDGQSCFNINECSSLSHGCGNNSKCLDIPGSYLCECESGFTRNGNVCYLNRCQINLNSCRTNAPGKNGYQDKFFATGAFTTKVGHFGNLENGRQQRICLGIRFWLVLKALRLIRIERCFWDSGHRISWYIHLHTDSVKTQEEHSFDIVWLSSLTGNCKFRKSRRHQHSVC